MKRGDVVILDYPFSDKSGSKVRPALVVQNDADNLRRSNAILTMITKSITGHRTQVLIDITTAEGKASGLRVTSAVSCGDLYTVAKGISFIQSGTSPTQSCNRATTV